MVNIPYLYPGILETFLVLLYIIISLSSNITHCLPPPEVEEGRYGNRYFGLGTLVGQDGGRDPSMLGVSYVNARGQRS